MKGLESVRQERYIPLLTDVCMQLHRSRLGLLGVWLFGSVARGEVRPNSDSRKRALAKYGDEARGLGPDELFDGKDARTAYGTAIEALRMCERLVSRSFRGALPHRR